MLWNSNLLLFTLLHSDFSLTIPSLIDNRNMTGNSVQNQCFVVLNAKLKVKLRLKLFY